MSQLAPVDRQLRTHILFIGPHATHDVAHEIDISRAIMKILNLLTCKLVRQALTMSQDIVLVLIPVPKSNLRLKPLYLRLIIPKAASFIIVIGGSGIGTTSSEPAVHLGITGTLLGRLAKFDLPLLLPARWTGTRLCRRSSSAYTSFRLALAFGRSRGFGIDASAGFGRRLGRRLGRVSGSFTPAPGRFRGGRFDVHIDVVVVIVIVVIFVLLVGGRELGRVAPVPIIVRGG